MGSGIEGIVGAVESMFRVEAGEAGVNVLPFRLVGLDNFFLYYMQCK